MTFHKPVRRPSDVFDQLFAADDPAEAAHTAHSTAHALVSRARSQQDAAVVDRLVAFADRHGIDVIARLWSHAPARTLPGTLWRLYLLQLMIHDDAAGSALLYQRGVDTLASADAVVAGAPSPVAPDELVATVDAILRGVFARDLGIALDRAAAFCRVTAAGATSVADDADATEPERAAELTRRALRLSQMAADLSAAARLWRAQSLD